MTGGAASREPGRGAWSGRDGPPGESPHLRLYIAGGTPNSVRAEANLGAAMRSLGSADSFTLEVIDVFVEPRLAMKDDILVTPTLLAWGAGARTMIVGDLGDDAQLKSVLMRLAAGDGASPAKS
jgi:circadian clock protein KaiB